MSAPNVRSAETPSDTASPRSALGLSTWHPAAGPRPGPLDAQSAPHEGSATRPRGGSRAVRARVDELVVLAFRQRVAVARGRPIPASDHLRQRHRAAWRGVPSPRERVAAPPRGAGWMVRSAGRSETWRRGRERREISTQPTRPLGRGPFERRRGLAAAAASRPSHRRPGPLGVSAAARRPCSPNRPGARRFSCRRRGAASPTGELGGGASC